MHRFVFAVFAALLPVLCPAEIEFTAYLQTDGVDHFLLTDLDGGAKSDWLTLGRSFRGRRLVAFDLAYSTLVVEVGPNRQSLVLRDAATREGVSSGLQVVKTEFGWFAPKQRQRGRGMTDVPLELGVTFGIETTLAGVPPKATLELELRFHTPPLAQPDGTVSTQKTTRQKISADAGGRVPTRSVYFTFEQASQLVPGIYRAELVHEGRVIASKAFNVSANAPPATPEPWMTSGGPRTTDH